MQPLTLNPSDQGPDIAQNLYNFAFVCAFFNTGSALVAFITSPLIFSFPDMNKFWAFFFPLTRFPKSSSERDKITAFRFCSQPLPISLKPKALMCLVALLHICSVVESCSDKTYHQHSSLRAPLPPLPLRWFSNQ